MFDVMTNAADIVTLLKRIDNNAKETVVILNKILDILEADRGRNK